MRKYIKLKRKMKNLKFSNLRCNVFSRKTYVLPQETNENTTNSEWELISINSSPKGVNDLPMKPTTMMRNQMKLPGGTKALYSSDEWAKSVFFWQNYLPVQPDLDS